MQIGIDSFVSTVTDPGTGVDVSPVQRVQDLLAEVELADEVGLDSYGIGEHHRSEYLDSAPAVLFAAAAADDEHHRVQQRSDGAQRQRPGPGLAEVLDLGPNLSGPDRLCCRSRLVHGGVPAVRARSDRLRELFAEELELLPQNRNSPEVIWSGRHRPSLTG